MKKSILNLAIKSIGVFSLALVFTTPLQANATWDGTADQPSYLAGAYNVTNAKELAWVAQTVNGGTWDEKRDVWLGADIDVSGHEWTPIGLGNNHFNVLFAGNGYKITGLNVNDGNVSSSDGEEESGLFGVIGTEGVVDNLIVEGEIVNVQNGGLIALTNKGEITDVDCIVDVDATKHRGEAVGGVVGTNEGIINGVTVSGTINSNSEFTGGIAGKNTDTGLILSSAYIDGEAETVRGEDTGLIGGIAGENLGRIFLSYNLADITGLNANKTGGIVGRNGSSGNIESVYNTGLIESPTSFGNIAGENSDRLENGFWLNTNGGQGIGSGTDNTEEFSDKDSSIENLLTHFVEATLTYNQNSVSEEVFAQLYVEGSPYPALYSPPKTKWKNFVSPTEPKNINGVYQIESAEELAWFFFEQSHDKVAGGNYYNVDIKTNAILIGDIDLSDHFWSSGDISADFSGTLDGDSYTISGLHTSNPFIPHTTDKTVIKNLDIEGTMDTVHVGGILTNTNYNLIENVSFSGIINKIVTSDNAYIGGFAGSNAESGIINNAQFKGVLNAVTNNSNIGGIVGRNNGLVINSSNSDGTMHVVSIDTDKSLLGGIVGYNESTGRVLNSYNSATLKGVNTDHAGIVRSNVGLVSNVYNVGPLEGTGSPSGVIVFNGSTGVAKNTYWLERIGASSGIGSSHSNAESINNVGFTDYNNINATVGSEVKTTLIDALNAGNEDLLSDSGNVLPYEWKIETVDSDPSHYVRSNDPSGDGIMNSEDLKLILSDTYYNESYTDNSSLYNDMNRDGIVNFLDLVIVRSDKNYIE